MAERIPTKKKTMVYITFILSMGALVASLVWATKTIKPIHLNLMAGVVILVGTGFGLFGKFLQDDASSARSTAILDTTNSLHNIITGGQSFCYYAVSFWDGTNVPLFILLPGEIILRNVQVMADDLARRHLIMREKGIKDAVDPRYSAVATETTYHWEYSVLRPQTGIFNVPIPVDPDQTEIDLRFTIHLDNGILTETLHVSNFKDISQRRVTLTVMKGDEIIKKEEF